MSRRAAKLHDEALEHRLAFREAGSTRDCIASISDSIHWRRVSSCAARAACRVRTSSRSRRMVRTQTMTMPAMARLVIQWAGKSTNVRHVGNAVQYGNSVPS